MAPILSEGSIYKPPSEASLAARSSTSKSSSSDQPVGTSILSSKQNLASDSDNRYSERLDAKWHPSFLQATTTTSASNYSSESIGESIVNSSSQQLSDNVLRDSLVELHAENVIRIKKAYEQRRRKIEHQIVQRAEYEARNTPTESNMNGLEAFFTQSRTRFFEPETSRISPTTNEAPRAWLQYREPIEEMPYEPAKPLFTKKFLRERQLEVIKTTEKVYIPREGLTPDIREAREQLRYGFMERQGGELLARRETLGDEENHDEEVDEELTAEQYWKRRLEEEHKSVRGSFWEHEQRRHR